MTLPRTLALALCLLGLGRAQAQDRVDQELDDSLQRAYEHPARPAEPIPDYAEREIEKERDQFQVTLRLTGAIQGAWLRDLKLVYREGSTGGATVPVMCGGDGWDVQGTLAAIPTVELNLGGYFMIRGSAWGASWRDDQTQVTAASAFRFGDAQFGAGDRVDSRFDLLTADIQLGAQAVTNRYVRLGLFGGARYLGFETTLERSGGGPYTKEKSRVEALVPTFTITLDVSPTPWLELYVNGTAGWFGYESKDDVSVTINGSPTRMPKTQRKATSLDVEAGMRFIFADHFGIYAGYRLGYLQIEREVPERKEGVRSLTHGPLAGILIQF